MQDLARLVPKLASARRLSKVLIVKESIRHLRQQRNMCVAAAKDVQDLLAENQRLTLEVNRLRLQSSGSAPSESNPKPITAAMKGLMSVKDEVYGDFSAGFGDNWARNTAEIQIGKDETQRNYEELELLDSNCYAIPGQLDPTLRLLQDHQMMACNMLPHTMLFSGPQTCNQGISVPCLSNTVEYPFTTGTSLFGAADVPSFEDYTPIDGMCRMAGLSDFVSTNNIPHYWTQDPGSIYDLSA